MALNAVIAMLSVFVVGALVAGWSREIGAFVSEHVAPAMGRTAFLWRPRTSWLFLIAISVFAQLVSAFTMLRRLVEAGQFPPATEDLPTIWLLTAVLLVSQMIAWMGPALRRWLAPALPRPWIATLIVFGVPLVILAACCTVVATVARA